MLEEYSRIYKGEQRLDIVKKELRSQIRRRTVLRDQVAKEYQDIVDLEKSSLRLLFSRVLKNREEQLEKERQEYLHAVIEYDECQHLIESLEYELKVLKNKIDAKGLVIGELDHKLNELLEQSPESTSALQESFTQINKDIKNLQRLIIEAEEARTVAYDLRNHILDMIKYLNEARQHHNWGEFYHEIQEGKRIKKENIDKAHAEFYSIKKLLIFLADELVDVEEVHAEFKRSEVIIRNFNIKYYRHLITDWLESTDLKNSFTSTMTVSKSIYKLIDSIEALQKSTKAELTYTIDKREKILQRMIDHS